MMVLALDPQSTGKRVTSLGHTIQILSKPSFFFFFYLTPYYCMFSGEAANICIIFLGLTQQDNNVNILHNRGSLLNHYSKKKCQAILLYGIHHFTSFTCDYENKHCCSNLIDQITESQ